ncbi:aldo/keto reductase [Paramicrobacterium agarici]|uniref:aldo/keto reductase n=1 Tax=Paramicrobacterium agarici TaxID=630514 RepID=UPI00114FA776|nr:aldo/keto reductase [Microbacterium agarici]TQO24197.1 L-glyceraldehyde 3-phosphate reductase [Microbacterium agarici]
MTYIADDSRYDSMRYRRAGRSGLRLPELSLGLWHNFGNERPIETQRAIIRRAFDLGVTHFDLANNYGPPAGSAETNFGRVLASDLAAYRDEIIISSKAGYYMWPGPYGEWGSRKNLLSSLDQSLARLGVDYVDVFYSHRPDPDTPIEETMGALASAVHAGKALYVGVSNYSPEQTDAAAAALAEHKVPLVLHQPSYSMFNRHVEHGLFPVLDRTGTGCVVFSPLSQGLLTDRYLSGSIPEGSRAATSPFLSADRIDDTYLTRARALNEIAADRGQSLAQLALAWILRQPSVTSALVGASSVKQLEQNIAALETAPLTSDEITAIEPFAVDGTGRG